MPVMVPRFLTLVLLCAGMFAVALTAPPATAQQADTLPVPQAAREEPKPADPKDIPEILLQEMRAIELRCTRNYFYSSLHDCRCVAVKYLDERIKNDPDTFPEQIYEGLAGQCADRDMVAGYIYTGCYNFMKTHRPDDYPAFCSCTANAVADKYIERPVANLRYIENLRKNAMLSCGLGNPGEYRAPQPGP